MSTLAMMLGTGGRSLSYFLGALVVVLALAAGNPAAEAFAAEPVEAFLEALRGRQYYDEAFEYLERLEASTQLEATFRERLLYEQAVTRLASAAAGTSIMAPTGNSLSKGMSCSARSDLSRLSIRCTRWNSSTIVTIGSRMRVRPWADARNSARSCV